MGASLANALHTDRDQIFGSTHLAQTLTDIPVQAPTIPAKCRLVEAEAEVTEGVKRYVSHNKVSSTDCFASRVKPIKVKWAKHSGLGGVSNPYSFTCAGVRHESGKSRRQPDRRSSSVVSTQLGEVDSRSMDFTSGKRMSGGVSRNTATITRDSMAQVFIGGDRSCGHRDTKVGRQGLSGTGFRGVGPISESHLHSTQEGRFVPPNFQSEEVECVGTIHPLQDGGHGRADKLDTASRLDVQNRLKRRISLRGDGRAASEVSPISLETPFVCQRRDHRKVCQPSFRPGVGTEDAYEVTEAGRGISQTVRHPSNKLPRRHLPPQSKSNRGDVGSKYHSVAPTDAGVRHQLGEVQFGPVTRDGVFGFCNRFPSFKPVSPSPKGVKNSTGMFEDVASGNCDSAGVGKSDWKPNSLDSCYSPCSLALSQTSDAQIERALEKSELRSRSSPRLGEQGGA